ncbi:MAG TPA: ABC transporter permease [Acidobacteriota bacterium]|jgi:lipooligosaccharide transport system permease protein
MNIAKLSEVWKACIALPSASLLAWRVWERNFRVFAKYWPGAILVYFADPIFYLIIFGMGLGGYIRSMQGESYLEFIAPGIIFGTAMLTVCMECTYGSFTRMEIQKTFEAIIATPLNIDDVILGEILWGTSKGMLTSSIVFLVVLSLQLFHSFLIILILPLVILEGILLASISLIVTSFASTYEYVNYYYALFIAPAFYLSGIFFPIDRFPAWLQYVAYLLPMTPLVSISRALNRGVMAAWMLGPLSWLVCLTLATALLAVNLMKRRLIK